MKRKQIRRNKGNLSLWTLQTKDRMSQSCSLYTITNPPTTTLGQSIYNNLLLRKSFATEAQAGNFQAVVGSKPNKKEVIHSFFQIIDFADFDLFKAKMSDNLRSRLVQNNVYTVYVKIRYNQDSFFMVGNQFGLKFEGASQDESSRHHTLKILFEAINSRLEEYFIHYNLVDENILYVQVSFRLMDRMLSRDLMIDIDKDKLRLLNRTERKSILDLVSVPIDESVLGVASSPLPVVIDENGKIKEIHVGSSTCNFLDIIVEKANYIRSNHKDAIKSFDKDYKFYHIQKSKMSRIDYILAVRRKGEEVEKLQYSMDGILLNRIIDIYGAGTSSDSLIRKTGSKTVFLRAAKEKKERRTLVKMVNSINFRPLDQYKIKDRSWLPNTNIGTIDTETFLTADNKSEIYALGFRTKLDPEPVLFYIGKEGGSSDSSKLVLQMIDELLRPKYKGITFYCHNFGGYDVIFILKVLHDYNYTCVPLHPDTKQPAKYNMTFIFRDDRILKLTIQKDDNTLTIVDSYSMLTNSLAKLGKDFGVSTLKSVFPYEFAVQDHLFYKGHTPGIHFYKDMTIEKYKEIYKEDWSFQDETIKYLKDDLNCLYEVLLAANNQIFKDFEINIKEALTISGLAIKIYLSKYYNNNIPRINKPSIYRDIKQAYLGGITEVYKPTNWDGETLYYYDVNSLYPFAALNDMPGLNCEKVTYYTSDQNIDNLFGFFYCKIESPKDFYLGLLPIRNRLGIELPLGSWEGWYFSEELKFAQENGYKITVIKGYNFNRVKDVFSEYIESIYKLKANPINPTQKAMAKSLLNNLLGRFGINLEKAITEVMTEEKFREISLFNKVVSYKQISDEDLLVSYIPKLDYDVIKSHNLDFMKVMSKYTDKELQSIDNSSIVISAAVTSYARIHISKIKLYILSKGGKIYYSDTDSIVTNIELGENMVDSSKLGKLKLEHIAKRGIFITNKTYCLIDEKDNFINKAKGIKSNSLTLADYEKLLFNQNVHTAIKTLSKKDWEVGEVKIFDKENITINSDSYTKRTKIYLNGKWVDTKPNTIGMSRGFATSTSLKAEPSPRVLGRLISNNGIVSNSGPCHHTLRTITHSCKPTERVQVWSTKTPIYRNYFNKELVLYKPFVLDLVLWQQPTPGGPSLSQQDPAGVFHPSLDERRGTHTSWFTDFLLISILVSLYIISLIFQDDEWPIPGIVHGIVPAEEDEIPPQRSYPSSEGSKPSNSTEGASPERSSPTNWSSNMESETKELEKLEEEHVKEILSKRSKDIFDRDEDIGDDIKRLFEVPEESAESPPSRSDEYTPLSTEEYEELRKEYRENREKLDTLYHMEKKATLSKEEQAEYETLLESERYYLDQKVQHFESVNREYAKERDLINSRTQKLEELKEELDKSVYSNKVRGEEVVKDQEKTTRLLNEDYLQDRSSAVSEAFKGVDTRGWDEKLSPKEKEYIESLDKEASLSVKRLISLENRVEENKNNQEGNKMYTGELVRTVGENTQKITTFKQNIDKVVDELVAKGELPPLPKDSCRSEEVKNKVAQELLFKHGLEDKSSEKEDES